MDQSFTHSGSSVTYLDHDHRKREDVRFLAKRPLVQHLRRGPWHSMSMLMRDALSDPSQAKIHDAGVTRVVDEDVCLGRMSIQR